MNFLLISVWSMQKATTTSQPDNLMNSNNHLKTDEKFYPGGHEAR